MIAENFENPNSEYVLLTQEVASNINDEIHGPEEENTQPEYVFLTQGVAPPVSNEMHEIKEEIKTIKKDLETIKQNIGTMEKDLETNKTLLEKVVDNQAKILACLLQTSNKGILERQALFPIENEEQMQTVDRLAEENKAEMINVIKRVLNPGGLQKNFHRLLDNKLIFLFNYDGVNGKKAFKDYKSLNAAIFEAVKTDGYTYMEYVKDIRESIKAFKNRIHKRKYDEMKKGAKNIVQAERTPVPNTT